MKTIVSMIAAHDKNLGIGLHNDLPWHISKDLQHFKSITLGKPVIMGRNTFVSIINRLKKPLPGRLNIVLTSKELPSYENVVVVKTIKEALQRAELEQDDEVFIIGGAQLYASALPIADKLYITLVDEVFACDAFFPHYESDFALISETHDAENGLKYSWQELTRK